MVIGVVFTFGSLPGCRAVSSAAHRAPVVQRPSAVDSGVFESVVRAIASAGIARLRVDARPLQPSRGSDPTQLAAELARGGIFDSLSFANVPGALLQKRKQVLRDIGVSETDALRNEACPGAVPPEIPVDRSACPRSESFTSVILSLPRQASKNDSIANMIRPLGAAGAVFVTRGILRSLTPNMSTAVVNDYYTRRTKIHGDWTVVRVALVFWVD